LKCRYLILATPEVFQKHCNSVRIRLNSIYVAIHKYLSKFCHSNSMINPSSPTISFLIRPVCLPVLSNRTGAVPELLDKDRGFLIDPEYSFRDVWGNAWRDMIDIEAGAKLLKELYEQDLTETSKKAKKYANSRDWKIPVKQLIDKIEEITLLFLIQQIVNCNIRMVISPSS